MHGRRKTDEESAAVCGDGVLPARMLDFVHKNPDCISANEQRRKIHLPLDWPRTELSDQDIRESITPPDSVCMMHQ